MGIQANLGAGLTADWPWINYLNKHEYFTTSGTLTEGWQAVMDDDGFPTRMPAGCTGFSRAVTLPAASLVNTGGPDDLKLVFAWDGDSIGNTFTFGGVTVQPGGSANRIVLSWPTAPIPKVTVTQTAINPADYAKNLRLMRLIHETDYNNGKRGNPDFIAVAAGITTWRFMDPSLTNISHVRNPDEISAPNQTSYYGSCFRKRYWWGTAAPTNAVLGRDDFVLTAGQRPAGWILGSELSPPDADRTNPIQFRFGQTTQPAPAWVSGTNYNAFDLVTSSGIRYICQRPHTAGAYVPTLPAVPGFSADLGIGLWRIDGLSRNVLNGAVMGNPTRLIFANPLAANWVPGRKLNINGILALSGNTFGIAFSIQTISAVIDANTLEIDYDSTGQTWVHSAFTVTQPTILFGGTLTIPGIGTKDLRSAGTRLQFNSIPTAYTSSGTSTNTDYQVIYDKVTDSLWTSQGGPTAGSGMQIGIPVERAIQLAYECGSAAWINIPAMANDDCMKALIQRCYNYAVPLNVLCKFEYSNEMWNDLFYCTGYATQQAQAKWGVGTAQPIDNWYGRRVAMLTKFARDIYAAHPSLVEVLMAGRANQNATWWGYRMIAQSWKNADPSEYQLYCPGTNLNGSAKRPGDMVDAIAPDGYLSANQYVATPASVAGTPIKTWTDLVIQYRDGDAAAKADAVSLGIEDAWHGTQNGIFKAPWLNGKSVDWYKNTYIPVQESVASSYRDGTIKVYQYEGGWTVPPENVPLNGATGTLSNDHVAQNAYIEALKFDPRIYYMFLEHFQNCDGAGHRHEPSLYKFIDDGVWSSYGFYCWPGLFHPREHPYIADAIDAMRGVVIIPPDPNPPPPSPPIGSGSGNRGHRKHTIQRSRMGIVS